MTPELGVKGICFALYAFDIGYEIDLERAQATLASVGRARRFSHKSSTHTATEALPFPLTFELNVAPEVLSATLPGSSISVQTEVSISIYQAGAVCVVWSLEFERSLERLVELSVELYADTTLAQAARGLVAELQKSLGDSVDRPRLATDYEDYFVFNVRSFMGAGSERARESLTQLSGPNWEPQIARLLRAEEAELSSQEISDAVSRPISYAPGEVCYVDWLSALLVGQDVHDELFVLELATVELLELRLLDRQLFRGMNEAYEILGRQGRGLLTFSPMGGDLARIARIKADQALLHEGVDNALKLFADDYLARLYRAAQERFHFSEWDASIERKLDTLDSVHQKLSDMAAWRRAELLEWIIIVLISAEILMSLIERFG